MKRLTPILAMFAIVLLAFECSAQPPNGKRGPNKDGKRAEGRRPDSAKMVARMMKEFDTDGDQKLDIKELTALMVAMRERRGGQGMAPGRQRPGQATGRPDGRKRPGADGKPGDRKRADGKPGDRKRGEGKRRRGGDAPGDPGGQKPKRPDAT